MTMEGLMEVFLRLLAAIGAVAHVYFFVMEALRWNVEFVNKVAPCWIKKVGGPQQAEPYVTWASKLAFNMGTYNLILAIGLAWVAFAGATVAGTLGIFLGIWLLGAALAANHTKVKPAFYAQGSLGILLLLTCFASR
jgi:uncharacterized membrane protein